MPDSLAAIVLAAGLGTRLAPLTRVRPKALCPVGNVPLVDLALAHAATVTDDVAVNVHAGREQLEAHLEGRVHVSVEERRPLGTAGAVGQLREWLDGRPALVLNADTWHRADLAAFVDGWDGASVALLVDVAGVGGLTPRTRVCASLLPWDEARRLRPEPAGLYEVCWQPRAQEGRLALSGYVGPLIDCGTPAGYLSANLTASDGAPVVGEGAVVEGELERSVVWPGGRVHRHERLVDAVRVGDRLTVLVR